ncbi:MAG: hypothetical protein JWO40_168 [Candidatus Doudnabacteria bacterium]|jgi:hypothetical protein|nr:hypothetical protein [Candidatus Doudnabacteria bacterium]
MTWIDPEPEENNEDDQDSLLDDEIEMLFQELSRKCWELARTIPAEDFLILRMHSEGIESAVIASRLKKSNAFVEKKIQELEQAAGDTANAPNHDTLRGHLYALGQYGQTTLCEEPSCGEQVQADCRFCECCGEKNAHFAHKVFLALNGRSLAHHRMIECRAGHPRAIFLQYEGYCTLCGIDLEPLTRTDSE